MEMQKEREVNREKGVEDFKEIQKHGLWKSALENLVNEIKRGKRNEELSKDKYGRREHIYRVIEGENYEYNPEVKKILKTYKEDFNEKEMEFLVRMAMDEANNELAKEKEDAKKLEENENSEEAA